MRALQIDGKRFGRLIALARTGTRYRGNLHWICRCDCWNYTVTTGTRLVSGHTQSCGCIRSEYASIIGNTYKHLIEPGDNDYTRRARNQSSPATCTETEPARP